ncbi:MAG TPA: ankyrin repeat domain-containing protein, partial [Kofleriaceae bacterium]|nr:ankyrin repeat domain-containing protein [Kofleriaceae bacterium]
MSRSELGEAALNGDLERLQQLIAQGALLDGSDGELYNDDTPGCVRGAPYYRPLGEAARMNHPECVRALLAAGAGLEEQNYTGETALIQAVRQDAIDCVKILLDAGADVHHVACLGTALAATQPGYYPNAIEIARLLIERGASPTTTASYARSALERWKDQIPTR